MTEPGGVGTPGTARILEWWTKERYSVSDLQRAYAEGAVEATRAERERIVRAVEAKGWGWAGGQRAAFLAILRDTP